MSSITSILYDIKRAIRLASKPTKEEFKATFKIVILGMSLLGIIGYFFQLAGAAFQYAGAGAIPREVVLFGGIGMAIAVLAVIFYLRKRSSL